MGKKESVLGDPIYRIFKLPEISIVIASSFDPVYDLETRACSIDVLFRHTHDFDHQTDFLIAWGLYQGLYGSFFENYKHLFFTSDNFCSKAASSSISKALHPQTQTTPNKNN